MRTQNKYHRSSLKQILLPKATLVAETSAAMINNRLSCSPFNKGTRLGSFDKQIAISQIVPPHCTTSQPDITIQQSFKLIRIPHSKTYRLQLSASFVLARTTSTPQPQDTRGWTSSKEYTPAACNHENPHIYTITGEKKTFRSASHPP